MSNAPPNNMPLAIVDERRLNEILDSDDIEEIQALENYLNAFAQYVTELADRALYRRADLYE